MIAPAPGETAKVRTGQGGQAPPPTAGWTHWVDAGTAGSPDL